MTEITDIKEKIKTLLGKENYGIDELRLIVEILRSRDGCAWDREQTHESIRQDLIEEAYEVCESIDKEDYDMMCEELGDVLLQVVFHASVADDKTLSLSKNGAAHFDFDKVCDGVCKKLIYRHPHVFADTVADDVSTVLKNWDDLKKKEKNQKNGIDVLESIPRQFPALLRCEKVINKAVKNNLDSLDRNDIINRIKSAVEQIENGGDNVEDIYSELLFQTVKLSACDKTDAERILENKCDIYIDLSKEIKK